MYQISKIDNIFTILRLIIIVPAAIFCIRLEDGNLSLIFSSILIFYILYSFNVAIIIWFKQNSKSLIYKITAYIDISLLLLALYLDRQLNLIYIDGFYIIITIHALYFGLRFIFALLAYAVTGYLLVMGAGLADSNALFISIHLGLGIILPILVGYLSDNYKNMTNTIEDLNSKLLKENDQKEKLLKQYREKNEIIYSLYNFSKMISSTVDIRKVFDNFIDFIKDKMGDRGLTYLIKKEDVEPTSGWYVIDASKELSKTENFTCFGIALIGKLAEREKINFLYNQKEYAKNICIFSHEGLRYKCNIDCIFNQGGYGTLHKNDKIILPIKVNQNIYGALLIFIKHGEEFFSSELTFFNSIINQLSIAIDKALAFKKLKKSSEIDVLTSVFNRGKLLELAEKYFMDAEKSKKPISFIFIDLDRFKNINDQFGHPTGDLVLYEVAQMLENSIRNKDICGRYGGEEFVIILPNAKKRNAKRIAEKLRRKVEDIFITPKTENPNIHVTISCGVATYPDDAADLEQTLEYADQALLRAKKLGRNRVVLWDEEQTDGKTL